MKSLIFQHEFIGERRNFIKIHHATFNTEILILKYGFKNNEKMLNSKQKIIIFHLLTQREPLLLHFAQSPLVRAHPRAPPPPKHSHAATIPSQFC